MYTAHIVCHLKRASSNDTITRKLNYYHAYLIVIVVKLFYSISYSHNKAAYNSHAANFCSYSTFRTLYGVCIHLLGKTLKKKCEKVFLAPRLRSSVIHIKTITISSFVCGSLQRRTARAAQKKISF